MRLRLPVTHVIFDMDGVLLDTERLYTEATQRICARFGKTFDLSLKSHMIGRPALDSARYLVRTLALPMPAEEFLAERTVLLETLMPTADPMPGARELTRALRAAGARLAVASSSSRALYDLKTRRHRAWFAAFDAVVLGDDPRVRHGKPAPDIFLVAAAELRADPACCVVIEDAPAGIEAARAAGMQVVAVPDPAMDPTPFADADAVVPTLTAVTAGDLGFETKRRSPLTP